MSNLPPENGDAPFRVDRSLLSTVWARGKRRYIGLSLVLLIVVEAGLLLAFPRKYISTASLSLEQSSLGSLFSGALNTITKGKSGITSSYAGVINSRKFAMAAIKAGKIDELYKFDDEDDSTEFMEEAVDLVDRYDGLARIEVSLPGPSPLLDKKRADKIREASKIVADSYVASFKDFVANSDTDRDSALIRQANDLLKQARADYAESVQHLTKLLAIPHDSRVDIQTAGLIGAEHGGPGMSQLEGLYLSQADVESQIRAAEATLHGTSALAASLSSPENHLPGEDPLLIEARRRVSVEEQNLQTLRVTLSDTNPDVVSARQRLENARRNLASEQKSVVQNHTSGAVTLEGLKARKQVLDQQIKETESTFKISRDLATQLELGRNDVSLKLEVLKAAETGYAQLEVQAVAGDSRLDMVDPPLPPKRAKPGNLLLAVGGIPFTLLIMGIILAIDYIRASRRQVAVLALSSGATEERVSTSHTAGQ